jgi:hypothetical protein
MRDYEVASNINRFDRNSERLRGISLDRFVCTVWTLSALWVAMWLSKLFMGIATIRNAP